MIFFFSDSKKQLNFYSLRLILQIAGPIFKL